MSWYQRDNPNLVKKPSTPNKNYVQVPDSSPIHIKSSPTTKSSSTTTTTNTSEQQPAIPSINQKLQDSKERELEAKRQKIRHHKDFPLISKKFYYLNESDIFKGFVKGKGNLRLITQWLESNFDRSAYLRKEEEEKQKRIQEQEKIRQKNLEDRMKREYEARQEKIRQQQQEGNDDDHDEDDDKHDKRPEYDDEDESPIKIKGRARVKNIPDMSPTKPNLHTSTKVEVSKPKQSILDKYKAKAKVQQSTLDRFGRLDSLAPKRRKLVKASSLETPSQEDSPIPAPSFLSAKFGYNDQHIPKLKKHIISPSDEEQLIEDDNAMIVDDDDLERLEEKIKQNKKLAKLQRQSLPAQIPTSKQVYNLSDEEEILEDDDVSDSMSEEEDEYVAQGITTIDNQILEFINNASQQDIADIAMIEPAVADVVIGQRPFSTIFDIAESDFLLPNETVNKRKKKKLGLKIVENTEARLKGYRAVDSLIKKCSDYGNSISEQMKSWGVSSTGNEQEGELNMIELDPMDDGEVEVEEKSENETTPQVENNDEDEDDDDILVTAHKRKGLRYIKHKPSLLSDDITLNNYQQVGINWLNLLYHNKLSCILADEMGLGKTCQVIAFMAHLKSIEEQVPHLVVVPASTIENWLREFNKFCPSLKVQAYHGSMKDREELRYYLSQDNNDYDVLITTYNLACGSSSDFKFLKSQNFNVVVYDEGHLLKNSTSERYTRLMRLRAKFRLLLTGTPLQNNLKELVSLLAFMLPKLFSDNKDDLIGLFNQKTGSISSNGGGTNSNSRSATPSGTDYNPLLSQQAIKRAKTMMTPFVLRRRKDQVLQHLPAKCHEVVYCDLTESQSKIYQDYIKQAKERQEARELGETTTGKNTASNVLMQLRKASLHTLLFRVHYPDETLSKMAKAIMNEPEYVEANQQYIFEDMQVMTDFELNRLCEKFPKTLNSYKLSESTYLDSGKVNQLQEILDVIINKRNEKVLIFSLFTQVLDILERVLSLFNYKFLRLDGSTSVDTRQDIIDVFYQDSTIPIFLLSTKAGGFGINLVAANNVIIYDQSFNPHDDKQAEDRVHRVGQIKEVTVYKLIVRKTIEEGMLAIAENKLQLDYSMSGEDNSQFEEKATVTLFEKILNE
ncbi:FUN30 [[Candida] subhashii]|uniref:DNA helicase n=1 Tax=[Candida] subhashii TaxID=561895 RepID=A0A8J5UVF3_9ASCO|nr:FUN30 [[Candida] subhashii]KAG7660949.1 FUN30 [[Candida] subhashii]